MERTERTSMMGRTLCRRGLMAAVRRMADRKGALRRVSERRIERGARAEARRKELHIEAEDGEPSTDMTVHTAGHAKAASAQSPSSADAIEHPQLLSRLHPISPGRA